MSGAIEQVRITLESGLGLTSFNDVADPASPAVREQQAKAAEAKASFLNQLDAAKNQPVVSQPPQTAPQQPQQQPRQHQPNYNNQQPSYQPQQFSQPAANVDADASGLPSFITGGGQPQPASYGSNGHDNNQNGGGDRFPRHRRRRHRGPGGPRPDMQAGAQDFQGEGGQDGPAN